MWIFWYSRTRTKVYQPYSVQVIPEIVVSWNFRNLENPDNPSKSQILQDSCNVTKNARVTTRRRRRSERHLKKTISVFSPVQSGTCLNVWYFRHQKGISKTEKCSESQNAEEYGDISSGNTENLIWWLLLLADQGFSENQALKINDKMWKVDKNRMETVDLLLYKHCFGSKAL